MSGYIGPIPVPQGIQNKETFTATAGQTTFNTNGYTDGAFISVYLNGVRLINGTDYTATNGSDFVLTQAASVSDVVDFESFNSFSLASQQFENITTKNPTHEDTDGGRESALSFQGEQSGGEISTLAAIQASHDGTADDQKGDLIFKTNDGSDNNAPTERLRIDSAGAILTATLGTDNVHLGEGAGAAIVSGGNNNVAIGKNALASNTTADNSTAVGFEAGTNSTGAQNTFFGRQSGKGVTSGTESVFIGNGAGRDGTSTGDYNIGIGSVSLNSLTSGHSNIAIGRDSLGANTTGVKNVVVGYQAADAVTDGEMNVAIGHEALSGETGGDKNVAIGTSALKVQNTNNAAFNTAVGTFAGTDLTDGERNTFIGGFAGANVTTADDVVCVGYNAGGAGTMTGHDNVMVGKGAGEKVTSGGQNVYIGKGAANDALTGGSNVIIGFSAGTSTTALTSGGTNTLIGSYTHASTVDASSAVGLGHSLSCATGYATIGHGGSDIRAAHGNTTWSTVSDERYKKDIVDSTAGLSFINDLQPKTFKYKNLGELPDTFSSYEEGSTDVFKSDKTQHGFIAQEVKTAIEAHSEIKDGFMLWDSRDDGSQEIAETALIPILTKAIQELSAKVDALETENTAIKARLDALEAE